MALLLRKLILGVDAFNEGSDRRTVDWPLMGSPFPTVCLLLTYWALIKWGPVFMSKRAPFEMDRLIQFYNLVQIVVCSYIAYYGIAHVYGPTGRYHLLCEPLHFTSTDEYSMSNLSIFYLYFLTKILDLLDTVFFVLRKKSSQISFLHVYHHSFMVAIIWYGMRHIPGGFGSILVFINSFVHSIMYFYYFLTNWNKEYRKNIWWKKYITQLQLFQFTTIFLLFAQFLLFQDCGYPKLPLAILFPQIVFITVLFADFYRRTYWMAPEAKPLTTKTD